MNLSELAFLNRQLSALIQDGVPLEGALRQAAVDLRGPLRTEIEALESDLSRGTPLAEAISRRRLPPLYLHLVRTGIAGGNLPAALAASADHFDERIRLQRRVQAALFYPTVVLAVGIGICSLALVLAGEMGRTLGVFVEYESTPSVWIWARTFVQVVLGLCVILFVAFTIPPLRRLFSQWLPGFRDARLAHVASAFQLLLSGGCPLPDAIRLVRELEAGSPVARDLAVWISRLEAGSGRLSEISLPQPGSKSYLPPFFRWLVLSAGDRVPEGFRRAANHYSEQARHRMDVLVNGLIPASMIALGLLILTVFVPLFLSTFTLFDVLGSD